CRRGCAIRIDLTDIPDTTADDNDFRIEDIQDDRNPLAKKVCEPPDGFGRGSVGTLAVACDDFAERTLFSRKPGVVPLERRTGDHRFDTSGFPAITLAAGRIQKVVTPLSSNAVQPVNDFAIHDDSATHSRA